MSDLRLQRCHLVGVAGWGMSALAQFSISSVDIARPLAQAGLAARHVPKWSDVITEVAAEARSGDVVLVMGARDPNLSQLASGILDAIPTRR